MRSRRPAQAAKTSRRTAVRIALLGTRGIPANYGGFETFAEELSTRLVARGHQVTVYCRERHSRTRNIAACGCNICPPSVTSILILWRIPSFPRFICWRTAWMPRCTATAPMRFSRLLPRLLGMPVALNVDGIERKRKKWNRLAKAWYRVSEWLATFCPTAVVTDAVPFRTTIASVIGKRPTFIPYGADTGQVETGALDRLGLEPGEYFLYVSRMEPENHRARGARKHSSRCDTPMKLALIGDAPYARGIYPPRAGYAGSARGDSGRDLREGLSRAGFALLRLHSRDGSRRHASGADRSDGPRGAGAISEYAGECGGGGRCRHSIRAEELTAKLELVLGMREEERDVLRLRAIIACEKGIPGTR